jgi:hypothetical protein
MRVLLDECLPRRLKTVLGGHDVQTVPEAGWGGKKNGDLLRLAAAGFDAFVTDGLRPPLIGHTVKQATIVPTADTPLYLDWAFWAVVTSVVALILSQLPPVHQLIRKKKLTVEMHSRIQITHKVGNPNAGVLMSIRNTGGRKLRFHRISLDLTRDDGLNVALNGQACFEIQNSDNPTAFVPVTMSPGETWTQTVAFYNELGRQDERLYRELESDFRSALEAKIKDRASSDELVQVDNATVDPFHNLFERLFVWEPGEYRSTLKVWAKPGTAFYSNEFRFTLYESDTADLRKQTDSYKYGAGISYHSRAHDSLHIPLATNVG